MSQYGRRTGSPIHPLAILGIVTLAFGAIATVGVYTLTASPVTLIVEGARHDVRTHQPRVADLFVELGVFVESQDIVVPPGDALITRGLTITIDKAHPVLIEADGAQLRTLTHRLQPAEILSEQGLTLGPDDSLYVDGRLDHGDLYSVPPVHLRVVRAAHITIDDSGATVPLVTSAQTVGEALDATNIQLYLADVVSPELAAPVTDGLVVRIQRSVALMVQVDGQTLTTRTHGATIADALGEIGIALIGLDYVIPEESAAVEAGMTVRIVRVSEMEEVERFDIDYERITRTDASIPPETQKVIQSGIKGVGERRTRVRLEDGIEVSRSMPRQLIVRRPRDEIIGIGAVPLVITPEGTASTQPGQGS